jgi:hypothetical protein
MASPPVQPASIATVTPSKPKYIRPKTADNGAPFPKKSGYIKNYPVQFTDGYSTVTVDNSQNNSDVFVKLVSLNSIQEQPIRFFFIRARESFKVEKVRPGNYHVRCQDLDSGRLFRTGPFNLYETRTGTGIEFSQLRLTLYQVPGGNMRTVDITEEEF